MKRQRAGDEVERSVRELRTDGRSLSEDSARRTREIAGYWMEQDAYRALRRGTFTPDQEEQETNNG